MRTLVTLIITLVIIAIVGCVRYEPYPNGMSKGKVIIHHVKNGK